MSVGVFHSFRASYVDPSDGAELHDAVNAVLREQSLDEVADPVDAPHVCEGWIDVDHTSGATLRELGGYARNGEYVTPHLYLLDINPYRVVFVPRLVEADETAYRQTFVGQTVNILVGSTLGLQSELLLMASELMIPTVDGVLTERAAADIMSGALIGLENLFDDEPNPRLHELQIAWLLMHEATVVSRKYDVPIVLAG